MASTLSEKEFPTLGRGNGAKTGDPNRHFTVNTAKWNSLFTREKIDGEDPSARKLHFHQPQSVDGKRKSVISAIDFSDEIRFCEKILVGYFVGHRSSFDFVEKTLKKLWNLKGSFRMTITGDSIFIIEFDLEEDRSLAMELGSVFISGRLFMIRPWHLFIEQSVQEMKSIPVWMNLYNIPIHLWNVKGISMIASVLGIPLLADKHTIERTRMSFARVCVEIDIDFDYPEFIPVSFDGREFKVPVEYTWKPPRCSSCSTFGHLNGKCPKTNANALKKFSYRKMKRGEKDGAQKSVNNTVQDPHVQDPPMQDPPMQDPPSMVINVEKNVGTGKDSNLEIVEQGPANAAFDLLAITGNGGKDKDAEYVSKGQQLLQSCVNEPSGVGRIQILSTKNSFSVLDPDRDNGNLEVLEDMSETSDNVDGSSTPQGDIEDLVAENDCEEDGFDDNDDSEYETDFEEMEVEKVNVPRKEKFKSVEEIPCRRPMTEEQRVDKLLQFSTLLGVSSDTADTKLLLSGIVKDYNNLGNSKAKKEQAKLFWPGVSCNDELGRGKRTPAKKNTK